jgi:hypothetical protein
VSRVALQSGADPRLDTRLRGIFQLQREEPGQEWCVPAAAPREASAGQR